MASKTVLLDDISGDEGAKTITFSLGERKYEVDLTPDNFAKLEKALAPYTKAGREVESKKNGDGKAALVRAWAVENGIEVSSKGRVPEDIIAKYDQAHQG